LNECCECDEIKHDREIMRKLIDDMDA